MATKSKSHNPITHNPYQGLTREQVLSTMQGLLVEETRNHFRMGLLYIYVVDSKLLAGSKYKRALDFICDNFQEVSRTALGLYGAVARAFSEAVCMRFGMTRLQLLLAYKKAAKIGLNHDEPGSTLILVPDAGGELKPKLFADCSAGELRQAVSHQRTPTPRQPISQAERALYDGYLQAIMSRFPKGSPVRVMLRADEGKTLIDFRGIPILEVVKLFEALLLQLYPERPLPEAEQAPQVAEPCCVNSSATRNGSRQVEDLWSRVIRASERYRPPLENTHGFKASFAGNRPALPSAGDADRLVADPGVERPGLLRHSLPGGAREGGGSPSVRAQTGHLPGG